MMQMIEYPGQAPSYLPANKKWHLVWHDEFDGDTLDLSKWDYRLHLMHKRHKTYTNKAAKLDGHSNLILSLVEKNGHFYSSHMQTGYNYMDKPIDSSYRGSLRWPIASIETPKFMHKFGYYEIRCKLQKKPGWWSAFWLQSSIIGANLDPQHSGVEVDIMESFEPGVIIPQTNHWNGYGLDHKQINVLGKTSFSQDEKVKLKDTPDGYHYFGLDWASDGYTFYVDGQESGKIAGPVSHIEQFILISTDCMGYREGDTPSPKLRKENLPDEFIIDHVRVFDAIDDQ